MLYTHEQVYAAIGKLKDTERFTTVLKVREQPPLFPAGVPCDKGGRRNVSSSSKPDPVHILKKATTKETAISGKQPKRYPELAKVGTRLSQCLYGLANQEQLTRLTEYLFLNGKYELVPVQNKGSCLFAAIRRGLDVPMEYSNTHLRRQMVMTIIKHPEFFFDMIKNSLLGQYGHERIDDLELRAKQLDAEVTPEFLMRQRLPGPFSFVTWLQHILKATSWGDEITLTVISMMWQIRITVVYAESLLQERVRHNQALENTDIVIVYCGGTHYCGAGKLINISYNCSTFTVELLLLRGIPDTRCTI